MVKLGEISTIKKGKKLEKTDDGQYLEILGGSIDKDGKLITSKMKRIDKTLIDENLILHPNDIVLTVDGTTDKSTLVKEVNQYVCGSTCVIIRCDKRNDVKKVYDFISSSQGKQALSKLKKGVTIPHIYLKDLENLDIPL